MKIRVYLIDDQPVVLAGLSSAAAKLDLPFEFQSHESLADSLRSSLESESVVVSETRLANGAPLAQLEELGRSHDVRRLIFYTANSERLTIARCLACGVFDVVSKTQPLTVLFEAIRRSHAGEDPDAASLMLATKSKLRRPRQNVSSAIPLTHRECQVLRHVAIGLSNREIGRALGISVETAKEHVQNILRKLDVADRTQAAIWAVKHDLA